MSELCVSCHQERPGRKYGFHLALVMHVTGSGTSYRLLGSRTAFVCEICAHRHLVLRYTMPLLGCVVAELGAMINGLSTTVRLVLAMIGMLLLVAVAPRASHTCGFTTHMIAVLGPAAVLLGPLLYEYSGSGPPWPPAVIGVVAVQLVMLRSMWAHRTPLLEVLAWRRSRSRLRKELGQPKLMAFNSVRYEGLHKPT